MAKTSTLILALSILISHTAAFGFTLEQCISRIADGIRTAYDRELLRPPTLSEIDGLVYGLIYPDVNGRNEKVLDVCLRSNTYIDDFEWKGKNVTQQILRTYPEYDFVNPLKTFPVITACLNRFTNTESGKRNELYHFRDITTASYVRRRDFQPDFTARDFALNQDLRYALCQSAEAQGLIASAYSTRCPASQADLNYWTERLAANRWRICDVINTIQTVLGSNGCYDSPRASVSCVVVPNLGNR